MCKNVCACVHARMRACMFLANIPECIDTQEACDSMGYTRMNDAPVPGARTGLLDRLPGDTRADPVELRPEREFRNDAAGG